MLSYPGVPLDWTRRNYSTISVVISDFCGLTPLNVISSRFGLSSSHEDGIRVVITASTVSFRFSVRYIIWSLYTRIQLRCSPALNPPGDIILVFAWLMRTSWNFQLSSLAFLIAHVYKFLLMLKVALVYPRFPWSSLFLILLMSFLALSTSAFHQCGKNYFYSFLLEVPLYMFR